MPALSGLCGFYSIMKSKKETIENRLMTYKDYQNLLKGKLGRYYKGRWEYFKKVIEIIKKEKIDSVLEIGPGQKPNRRQQLSSRFLFPKSLHFIAKYNIFQQIRRTING